MRRVITVLAVSLLALASAGNALAQVATTGTIQIILEDAQGGRLPGVTVTATAADVVTSRTAVSDAQGVATLEALAPSEQYTIKASLTGFREITQDNVLARSGQTTTLRLPMSLSSVSEQITVTASPVQVVDTTRAITGQDITLQLTEALPTGRSYQSYLQFVPGVLPDSTISGGNPSSRSGMNWKDASTVNDNIGASTDNRYYFEGINVTDPVTGTFGANLNTEIIQEQKVITGGIPAEYVGAAGLISTVITKSGSNRYSGSANYFFQNNNLVSEDKHNAGKTFSTRDTAFTIGGPLMKDKLWGFGSFRSTNRNEDVSASDTHVLLREVETTAKQGFAKVTWVPTQKDLLSFMFLNDPQDRSGSTDASIPNNRSVARVQGGNNFSTTYSRVWSRLLVDAAFNHHQGEISDEAVVRDKNRNTVVFQRTDTRTIADEQLGGAGSDIPEFRPTTQFRGSAQYQTGVNRIKAGYEWATDGRQSRPPVPPGQRSVPVHLARRQVHWRQHHGGEHCQHHAVDGPHVQRHQRQRLQRPHRHGQQDAGGAEERVLQRVRHRQERDHHVGGARGVDDLQQHGRQPGRHGELLPDHRDGARGAGTAGPQLRVLRAGRHPAGPMDVQRRPSRRSASRTTPRPATASSRSTGPWRRA